MCDLNVLKISPSLEMFLSVFVYFMFLCYVLFSDFLCQVNY